MKNLEIPLAILAAGVLIAGSVFFSGGSGSTNASFQNRNGNTASISDFRKLTKDDHLRGNPDAKVTIIEFSDFECPFCARLHPTLSRLVEEREDVNWVYRHFPLSQIHSRALNASLASECVAKLAGNDAFWKFGDTLFQNQRNLGQELYNNTAEGLGISAGDLEKCMGSDDIARSVRDDLDEAIASGGRGTPFSVAITANGDTILFSGALPYESIVSIVEQALLN